MCRQPGIPGSHLHFYRNRHWNGIFHRRRDQTLYFLLFFLEEIKNQLIVNLEQHPRFQVAFSNIVVNSRHRNLDHVGGSALDPGIDGVALGTLARCGIARLNISQISAASGDGLDKSVFLGKRDGLFDVLQGAGKLFEILGYQLIGLGARHVQPVGQSKGGNAVNDAKIDRLCLAAHIGGDVVF